MALIPFVTTHPQQHNIVRFLLSQTKFFKRSHIMVLHKHISLRSSDRFMVITALKRVVSRIVRLCI
jgi:hypothetical protein